MKTVERMIELGPVQGALNAVWGFAHRLTICAPDEIASLVEQSGEPLDRMRDWWRRKKPESDHFQYIEQIATDFDRFSDCRKAMEWDCDSDSKAESDVHSVQGERSGVEILTSV